MILLIRLIFSSAVIILGLKFLSLTFSEKVFVSREDLTYYECGFESKTISRVPFSFRYFSLTLIFLLFDLELLFLVLIPIQTFLGVTSFRILTVFIFILILVFGLVYE